MIAIVPAFPLTGPESVRQGTDRSAAGGSSRGKGVRDDLVDQPRPYGDAGQVRAEQAHESDDEYDTVGGLITSELGHLPEVGETTTLGAYQFKVTAANDRRVQQFRVSRQPEL